MFHSINLCSTHLDLWTKFTLTDPFGPILMRLWSTSLVHHHAIIHTLFIIIGTSSWLRIIINISSRFFWIAALLWTFIVFWFKCMCPLSCVPPTVNQISYTPVSGLTLTTTHVKTQTVVKSTTANNRLILFLPVPSPPFWCPSNQFYYSYNALCVSSCFGLCLW